MADNFGNAPSIATSRDLRFSRLRTDQAKTGFYEGRQFRSFWEYSIATATTQVLRVTVTENLTLLGTNISLDISRLRLTLRVGGTPPAGPWTPIDETSPAGGIFRKNNMTDAPTDIGPEVVIEKADGAFSGGIILDVARLLSESTGNRAATVGDLVADERGISPGTYYYVFDNIDGATASGVFSAFWEVQP